LLDLRRADIYRRLRRVGLLLLRAWSHVNDSLIPSSFEPAKINRTQNGHRRPIRLMNLLLLIWVSTNFRVIIKVRVILLWFLLSVPEIERIPQGFDIVVEYVC